MRAEPAPEADTRECLIRAAVRLFAEKGYEGASVKDVAQAAGVNVSLVSYHFGGKEGLLRTCLEQFGKEGLGIAQRVLKEPQSIEELRLRLKMFVDEVLRMHLAQPDHVRILHRECDLEASVAQDVFRNTFHKVFLSLVGFIDKARKKGLLRKNIDPAVASTLFFGALIHPVKMARQMQELLGTSIKDPEFREKVADHLVGLFLTGFGKPAGTQSRAR